MNSVPQKLQIRAPSETSSQELSAAGLHSSLAIDDMAGWQVVLNMRNAVDAISSHLPIAKHILHSLVQFIAAHRQSERAILDIVRQAIDIALIMSKDIQAGLLHGLPHITLINCFESILVDIEKYVRRSQQHRFRNILKKILFPENPVYPAYAALSGRLSALSISLQERQMNIWNGPSFFAGASNLLVQNSTFVQTQGDFVINSERPIQRDREVAGIVEGLPVIEREDVFPIQEIFRDHGYRLHLARLDYGKIVTVKVYQGETAKERCIKTARLYQKSFDANTLHMIGISPSNSKLPFLVFEGEYEGNAAAAISFALGKSVKETVAMGVKTVAALSSGLDHLQSIGYPFESAGMEHFSVLHNLDGRIMICFDATISRDFSHVGHQPANEQNVPGDEAFDIFHALCLKTFDDACKAHYESQRLRSVYAFKGPYKDHFEETDENEHIGNNKIPGVVTENAAKSSPQNFGDKHGRSEATESRRELVWDAASDHKLTLREVSLRFKDFHSKQSSSPEFSLTRYRGSRVFPTAHWCPGYKRVDVNLSIDVTRCAIVFHVTPNPNEICTICKQVVRETEKCVCGESAIDGSIATVRCVACRTWYHCSCVHLEHSQDYVCSRCTSGISGTNSVASGLSVLDNTAHFVLSVFQDIEPSAYRSISLSAPNWRSGISGFVLNAFTEAKSLYIDGTKLRPNNLRERILVLLAAADEKLDCSSLVVVLDRSSPNLASLLHSLLYVGGVIPKGTLYRINPLFTLVELEV